MKRAFKILIPILMTVALILCTGWYLFEYDKEFTQDALLSSARYFENNGSPDVAQWFYNRAYEHSDNNDEVAIELASRYEEAGNLTKAEFTLYNAIQDGGDVDLYVALCKLYVKQDKLLDALNLLQNAAEPIKSQLHEMRPADPVASVESGTLNEYTSIEFSAPEGKVYVTTQAVECPSVTKDAYTGPIELQQGANVIYAICVGDNGLVSPVKTFEYTLGGIIEPVEFADSAVEAMMHDTFEVPQGMEIYTNELWNVTSLEMPQDARSYSDLQYFTNLQSLTIHSGRADQLKELVICSTLTELTITDTSVSADALEIIGTLTQLEKLTLSQCSISTIASLSNLTNLTYMDLSKNTLRQIDAVSNMSGLQELYLGNNAVNDLSILKSNTKLTRLDVSYNSVSSLEPVFSLPGLTWIDAQHNTISSVTGVGKLKDLGVFNCSYNNLTNVSALSGCKNLVELDISNNQITDITAFSALTNLMYFNFAYNQVVELPLWPTSAMLVTIDGSHNLIETVEPLAGLENLNNVLVDYNEAIETLDPLVSCHALIKVNAFGTMVIDVSSLNGLDPETGLPYGVIVNYDPTLAIEKKEQEEKEAEDN